MKKYVLENLWDEHTKYEFATPEVVATLATMIADAYVNHVRVMTGGQGKSALRASMARTSSRACSLTLR
jgi:carboxymethylenebutenolidase